MMKCLSYKHGDLSSIHTFHIEPGVMVYIFKPGETETGGSLGSLASKPSLAKSMSPRSHQEAYLRKKHNKLKVDGFWLLRREKH